MKKLHFIDQVTIKDFDYYNFIRVTKSKSKNNIGYFIYYLDKKLNDKKIDNYNNQYSNIRFDKLYNRNKDYTTTVLLVYDKKIK